MYHKWKVSPNFDHMFTMIDNDNTILNEAIADISCEDANDDTCMDKENGSDQLAQKMALVL